MGLDFADYERARFEPGQRGHEFSVMAVPFLARRVWVRRIDMTRKSAQSWKQPATRSLHKPRTMRRWRPSPDGEAFRY